MQNTVNASTPVTKTPTHYKSHTYTYAHTLKQVKTNTVQGWVAKGQRDSDKTGQQNLTFFGPQTSIDELSSTYYAEFRYVHRIVSNSRVTKIQRN